MNAIANISKNGIFFIKYIWDKFFKFIPLLVSIRKEASNGDKSSVLDRVVRINQKTLFFGESKQDLISFLLRSLWDFERLLKIKAIFYRKSIC